MSNLTSPSFTVAVHHPGLARVMGDWLQLHGFEQIAIVPADGENIVADATLAGENMGGLRLGAVLDWVTRRAAHPLAHIPSTLSFTTGQFQWQNNTYTRISDGQGVRLTDKERDLIMALYRAPDRFLPKDRILADVWGYVPGLETHTLETHIYRLRQKIEHNPSEPDVIVTEAGGYRLVLAG